MVDGKISAQREGPLARTLENQARAADPAGSAWVSANAGSGKTRVLTDRVIRLLLSGTSPSKILCLTFTKAAAGEMANRLFDRLGTWTTLPDEKLIPEIEKLIGETIDPEGLTHARRLFARALETPGGLKIQTIHAFAQSVLTRFPLEARVSPHFEVIDERTSGELLLDAQEAAFARADRGDDAALKAATEDLTSRLDQLGFAAILQEVVKARGKLSRLFQDHGGPEGAVRALRQTLGLGDNETEADILRSSLEAIERQRVELNRAADQLAQGGKTDQAKGEGLHAFLHSPDLPQATQGYVALFLTAKGDPRKSLVTKPLQKKHSGLEDLLRQEQARVLEVEAKRKAARAAEATLSLFTFANHLLEEFEARKARRGVLDYDDLIGKTASLLMTSSAAWVHFKLDGGIDHILVDEAQDTSPDQWRIIERLSTDFFAGLGVHQERAAGTSRTIFAVGDEKQSIYSFQGADPDEFERKRIAFETKVKDAEQPFSTLDLILSFRSTSEILKAVDTTFADPSAAKGLTSKGSALTHEAHRLGIQGLVELWPTIVPQVAEVPDAWDAPLDRVSQSAPRAILADKIAETIDEWIKTGETATPQGKPIEPGDILILVQRRDTFVDEMIRALKKRDIPVAGRDRMVLIDQLAVMDMLALVEFALLPEDDLTLAVVLKSPFIGFDDEDLFDLAHGRTGTLWQSLRDKSPDAESNDSESNDTERFASAYQELNAVLARVETLPPYEFLARALGPSVNQEISGRASGRERLLTRLGLEAADPIDELLNLALAYERSELPSLQGFLHWVREDASDIKRDFDLVSKEVRIMTVHGAKGLEGRIVILPDTCSAPSSRHDPELLSLGQGSGAPLVWRQATDAQDDLSTAERARLAERRHEEHLRLLYVAMTRAQDRLYICGYETQRGRSEGCWYDLIETNLKPLMHEHPDRHGELIWRLQEDKGETTTRAPEGDKQALAEEVTLKLPAWALVAAPLEEVPETPLAPSKLSGGEEPAPPTAEVLSPIEAGPDNRFKRGLLVHKLLQYLPEMAWEARPQAAQRFLTQPAHGLGDQEIVATLDEVMAILNDETFAPIFGPGSFAEAPLVGRLPGTDQMLNGQVDRLLVTHERILVVDYKTNRPPPTRVEDVAPLYIRQMAAYRALLQEIYAGRPVECALLWTVGPWFMALPEAAMSEALNQLLRAKS